LAEQIPHDAVVILQLEGDEDFNGGRVSLPRVVGRKGLL
jgi:hypothetical protein